MRKYGFTRQPPRARARPQKEAAEESTLDLAVNALDTQLARWKTTLDAARRQPRLRKQLAAMEELGRDLQSMRDWCARTTKPSLRRALLAEANRILRKMQKFGAAGTSGWTGMLH